MYNEQRARLVHEAVAAGGGYNVGTPTRQLQPGEATYLRNARVSQGRIVPGKAPLGTNLWSTSEAIVDSFIFQTDTSKYLMMVGSRSVWNIETGVTPVDLSPLPAFQAVVDPMWQHTSVLHQGVPAAVIHNRVDIPHKWQEGDGALQLITGAPIMKTCLGFMGRLIGGGVYTGSAWHLNQLEWSGIDDIFDWSGLTWGTLPLPAEADPIQKLMQSRNNVMLIFRADSIWGGYVTDQAQDPLSVEELFKVGCWSPNSVQAIPGAHLFLGKEAVYIVSPTGIDNVSLGVRRDMFKRADPERTQFAWSYVDRIAKEYYIAIVQLDGTQVLWCLNYEEGKWSSHDATGITLLGDWYEI